MAGAFFYHFGYLPLTCVVLSIFDRLEAVNLHAFQRRLTRIVVESYSLKIFEDSLYLNLSPATSSNGLDP